MKEHRDTASAAESKWDSTADVVSPPRTGSRSEIARIVALVQLPPPVHGASLMNQYVTSHASILHSYSWRTIPLRFASALGDIGKARPAKLMALCRVWIEVVRVCIRHRPDLAYFTLSPCGWAFVRDLTIVGILKTLRIPTLFHLHGRGMLASTRPRPLQPFYRWAFAGSTVIHLSQSLYEEVSDLVPLNRFHVVPNGIPDSWRGEARRQGTADDACTILYVSNMMLEKGPLDLLRAVAYLRDRGTTVRCSFVGPFLTDDFRKRFEKIVKENRLEQQVLVHGALYDDKRDAVLGEAGIFAFPSFYRPEAFPLVVLEAMSHGLPVVAARVGALEEIVDDGITGFLVPPGDVTGLAEKLLQLYRDRSLRRRMGTNGRSKYLERYTLSAFVQRLTEVIDSCLTASARDRV